MTPYIKVFYCRLAFRKAKCLSLDGLIRFLLSVISSLDEGLLKVGPHFQYSISCGISPCCISGGSFIKQPLHSRSLRVLRTHPCFNFSLLALWFRNWQPAGGAPCCCTDPLKYLIYSPVAAKSWLFKSWVQCNGFWKHRVILLYFIHYYPLLVVDCCLLQSLAERKQFGGGDIAEKDKIVNVKMYVIRCFFPIYFKMC